MHEVSIARSLLRLVLEGAEKNSARLVKNVSVKVGRFAGVEVDLLERAYKEVSKNTIAENSVLEILDDPFRIYCNNCNVDSELSALSMVCPLCKKTDTKVLGGQKIELLDLEISV